MRILITITPRLYREVLALSIHRRRSDFEVMLVPPWLLDGETERFGPYVLVQDDEEADLSLGVPDSVLCRILLHKADRIDATIELHGTSSELRDVSLEDLYGVLDEAESLSRGDG